MPPRWMMDQDFEENGYEYFNPDEDVYNSNYYNHSCDSPYFFDYTSYRSNFLYEHDNMFDNLLYENDDIFGGELSDIEVVDDE